LVGNQRIALANATRPIGFENPDRVDLFDCRDARLVRPRRKPGSEFMLQPSQLFETRGKELAVVEAEQILL